MPRRRRRPREGATKLRIVPRVTVIIATYNYSSILPYSIGSVLRQTFTDFELLVVGDACTDDSEEVVARMNDPRVRWINLPSNTRHQSGPNNEGLRQARGEIIAYLGHDDLWFPHHLEALVAAYDDEQCDLAYPVLVSVDTGGAVTPVTAIPSRGQFMPPSSMTHRRRVTETLGGWRDYREISIGPEVDLWQRAWKAGCRFTFVPRLSAIKFSAAVRRDVYKNRPCREQAAWSARLRNEPDLEARLLASFVADGEIAKGFAYRDLVRYFWMRTLKRLPDWFSVRWITARFAKPKSIDDIRRFKGL